MNNPFEYWPGAECLEAYGRLLEAIGRLRGSGRPEDEALFRELEAGKMQGVLVAEDAEGRRHELFAFSGQLGEAGFRHSLFVEPVFDYLDPAGYFKQEEARIVKQNREIERFVKEELWPKESAFTAAQVRMQSELEEWKLRFRLSKEERARRRASGEADSAELAAMTRQSQFEKAELRRIRQRLEAELLPFATTLREKRERLIEMKAKRKRDSEALQRWLFDNFKVLNARGEERSLSEIFAQTAFRVPPSGAGECCAPKLLQAAYRRGLRPIEVAEFWHGAPKGGEIRIDGRHYPACRGKCGPVLGWMLEGLDVEPPLHHTCRSAAVANPKILYEDEWLCVVEKPSGLLSVPGKGEEQSVQGWLEDRYADDPDPRRRKVKLAHRLDQDTSGLLVAAFGEDTYKLLQRLFATREVKKTYVAILEGDFRRAGKARQGRISLPLAPDILDRPRQRVDHEAGKDAVTDYAFLELTPQGSRIEFHPLTGRTHQLRVHAASAEGLGMPIAGDRLYGRRPADAHSRLLLHAYRLEFIFPATGRQYEFVSPLPF